MTKARWMAAIGLVVSALCSWALRRWASNQDVHALVDVVRDLLPVFGLTFAGVGLVGGKAPNAAGDIEPPKALLPLLFAGALLANGCAFGQCMLGKLGSTAQIAFATAQKIAADPGSTSQDLVVAATQFAPGVLDCGAKAALDWLDKSAGRKAGYALGAPPDHQRTVLRAYLAGKTLACADPYKLRERPHRVAMLETCEEGACRPVVVDEDVPE